MLSENDISIIKKLIQAKSLDEGHYFPSVIEGELSREKIDFLCEILSDEFLKEGITATFEPNDYGRLIESIIDKINKVRR